MYLVLHGKGRGIFNKVPMDSIVAMKWHRRSAVRKNAMAVTGFQGVSSIGVRLEPNLAAERLPLPPYPLFTARFSCYESNDVIWCSNATCLVNGRRGQKPLLTVSSVPNAMDVITQRVRQKA